MTALDKAGLMALADRVEALAGPCRETDVAIGVAVDWRWPDWEPSEKTARQMAEKHGLAWLVDRAANGFNSCWRGIPNYTASLDAAMTLVPEGFAYRVDWRPDGLDLPRGSDTAPALGMVYAGLGKAHVANASTPALALTAAALRALAGQP
jgi:hypothetical protein